jgi:hypothetical protein
LNKIERLGDKKEKKLLKTYVDDHHK